MRRLKAAGDSGFIQGIPELWTVSLERMARDESIDSIHTALICVLEAWFAKHPDVRQIAEDSCLLAIGKNSNPVLNIPLSKLAGETSQQARQVAELLRLVHHHPVSLLLAARRIASIIESGCPSIVLSHRLPHDLIKETARLIARNSLAREHLHAWINRKDRNALHPMAASLLHAIIPRWRPGPDCRPRLKDAYLTRVAWSGVNLTAVNLESANLNEADLNSANLGQLTAPDFHDANLRGALLTGSQMQKANFLGANLSGAGLAEIDWPGANLCDSDLRGASFHLGSSRNGLVGSPIACEGSRTGFYTDDYNDQDIKPAEEIRKANLYGADLRGAEIEGVDFYLVDLRNAKYTREQAEHFHRCRAILCDRVG